MEKEEIERFLSSLEGLRNEFFSLIDMGTLANPMVLFVKWTLAAVVLLALTACGSRAAGTLSPADERVLLRMAWEEAIEERKLLGLERLEANPPMVLRADPRWPDLDLSSLPAVELLDQDALDHRAATLGTFEYLSFRCCQVQPDGQTVRVTVQISYARSPEGDGLPMGGSWVVLTAQRGLWGWKLVKSQAVVS